MKSKTIAAMVLAMSMVFTLVACGNQQAASSLESSGKSGEPAGVTITDMIGREVTVLPGS